mgnify:CR=1 FL=1
MKKIFLLATLFSLFFQTQAQLKEQSSPAPSFPFSVGLGLGMNYGGMGANLMLKPHYNVGIFGCAGYALAGLGANAGIKVLLNSEECHSVIAPYALAMYGYNTAVVVENESDLNKLFYGATLGAGIDYRTNRNGYWTFAILVPIRGSNVDDYMDDLKNNQGVEFKNDLFPIGVSLGYNFILGD